MSHLFQAVFRPRLQQLLENHPSIIKQSKPKVKSQTLSKQKQQDKYKYESQIKPYKPQNTQFINSQHNYNQSSQYQSFSNNNYFSQNFNIFQPCQYLPQIMEIQQNCETPPVKKNFHIKYVQNNQFTKQSKSLRNQQIFQSKKQIEKQNERQHDKLKQRLIKSAGVEKQSQRLTVIFESGKKNLSKQKTQGQSYNKQNNSQASQVDEVDQVSRRYLRKSFCLKLLQADDNWEEQYSQNKSASRPVSRNNQNE